MGSDPSADSRYKHAGTSSSGFGTALPGGFTATKEEYVDWIIKQIEAIREPIDLVGHDWGCILSARVASVRPDLIRSWAGGSGPVSAAYEWHPLAKIWQTAGDGEKWMADLEPKSFSELLQLYGASPLVAGEMVQRIDSLMKDCILRLYRSAVHVGSEWEPELSQVTSPSLVFWGKDDVACPIEYAERLRESMRASRVLELEAAHWTPLQRSREVVDALVKHWNSVV